MRGPLFYILLAFVLAVMTACSSDQKTLTSLAYHNTTAHFNGYYYAREEIKKVEKTVWSSMVDDYNRVLRLCPALDSAQAKGYDKDIQEAIKMASLAIQRHPNSKWVDDSYLLVGKARFYSMDWGNAIQTFKFVNTKSLDLDTKHAAIIELVRTFTEHKEYNNAQAAIDFVQKGKLSKENKKNLLLAKAYFYQEQGDLDYMVRNLTEVTPLLKKKDRPGRIFFIIGQIYQKLGFESEAYNYYKRCLSTNPEYEVDFYARLYMAQVTEISRSKSVNAARKSFRKLLKDSKNKEFKDKIFYEMGVFELKQKNLAQALEDFNRSIREGNNKRIDGEAYLRLGEIYYDTLRKYELSQAYYDSAINALPKDYEGYDKIKARQSILDEFVKNLNTIKWQDSLLAMSALDSSALRARIDSAYQAKKRLADSNESKKKKKRNRVEIVSNTNNVFSSGDDGQQQEGDDAADWYFGNPSAMSLGQTEFQRIWGNITLEDNWRRSLRTATAQAARSTTDGATPANTEQQTAAEPAPSDPVAAEYTRVDKQIPRTAEQKKEALKKIEDAYFALGDIYYFKLLEKDNAVTSYNTLLRRFPETAYEPEILYKLYLIFKDIDPAKSESYASLLKTKYPNSDFAKILINPDYLKESSQTAEKQKELYKTGYDLYQNGEYRQALQALDQAAEMGETSFSSNIELMKVILMGKTEDINQYQFALDQFIKTHPDDPLTTYAKKLLDASHTFQTDQEKVKGIQYIRSFEEPHYFVLVHRRTDNLSAVVSAMLERFDEENFKELKLKTSNLVLNDEYILTLVDELPRISWALEYKKTFNEKLSTLTELRNHKFHSFVITKDNFDIFYRTKGLDEYLQFFERNYPAESQ
ncbi:TolA-binding protein [Chryseolinea serpens]|uniref:TolA-binding protein n=1 Tax=Chryseolinea serpens TaxID=947013 RepID=A0A1M5NXK8_9BACT|nr:tetratricopeptide repeat protein [Chryseolinea serpens]SHG93703.1 TolA-binding protein [Chryseolinea serpens]